MTITNDLANWAGTGSNTNNIIANGASIAVGNTTNNLTIYGTPNSTSVAVAGSGSGTKGGTYYYDFLKATNISAGATNPNKWFRVSNTGTLEVINSGYNNAIMTLTDSGGLTIAGSINTSTYTAGQVIKDTMLSNTDFTVPATTVATSTSDTDFISYSYTPVSNSSYLIIHVHVGSYEAAKVGGSGQDSYFSRIKVDGNEITYAAQYTRDTYTFRTGALFPLIGRYTNSNTSAKAITVGVRRDVADDSITIVNSATALWMRITEIAR